MRSAGPAKMTLWSPTTVPPRSDAKPMSPGWRAPVTPSRAALGMVRQGDAAAFRRRLAEQQSRA